MAEFNHIHTEEGGRDVRTQKPSHRGKRYKALWERYVSMSRGRLTVLMGSAVIIAILFSGVGLYLYGTSGAAQLDLSRPGYEGITQGASEETKKLSDFSSSGPIDEATLQEFDQLFSAQRKNVKEVNAFGGDPMSPEGLGIHSSEGDEVN